MALLLLDHKQLSLLNAIVRVANDTMNVISADDYLGEQYEGCDDDIIELADIISSELEDEQEKEEQKSKGPLSKEQTDLIFNTLLDYVVTKKPSDLSKNHDGDWFSLNERGQTCWNWRNSEHPLLLIAENLGLSDE